MTGCRHVVDYKVTREDRAIMRHFPGNLRVAKFTDMAPKHPSINLLSDNEHWKTNALDVYRHHEYADGISRMVAKDLAGMGLFDHVLGPEDREPATD